MQLLIVLEGVGQFFQAGLIQMEVALQPMELHPPVDPAGFNLSIDGTQLCKPQLQIQGAQMKLTIELSSSKLQFTDIQFRQQLSRADEISFPHMHSTDFARRRRRESDDCALQIAVCLVVKEFIPQGERDERDERSDHDGNEPTTFGTLLTGLW